MIQKVPLQDCNKRSVTALGNNFQYDPFTAVGYSRVQCDRGVCKVWIWSALERLFHARGLAPGFGAQAGSVCKLGCWIRKGSQLSQLSFCAMLHKTEPNVGVRLWAMPPKPNRALKVLCSKNHTQTYAKKTNTCGT